MHEPLLHSQITDSLPDTHPLAYMPVACVSCHTALHASNNECMEAWIETGVGAFCLRCFAEEAGGVIDEAWGLSEE